MTKPKRVKSKAEKGLIFVLTVLFSIVFAGFIWHGDKEATQFIMRLFFKIGPLCFVAAFFFLYRLWKEENEAHKKIEENN